MCSKKALHSWKSRYIVNATAWLIILNEATVSRPILMPLLQSVWRNSAEAALSLWNRLFKKCWGKERNDE